MVRDNSDLNLNFALIFFHQTNPFRFQLEAMNRSLQDIMKTQQPFGGKILVMAGDLRQCLPVIPGGNRAQVVDSCIVRSFLWPSFKILSLNTNMRVAAGDDPDLQMFDSWQIGVGDGDNIDVEEKILIPSPRVFSIKQNCRDDSTAEHTSMITFCKEIYPNLEVNINDPTFLQERSILCPTNIEVDTINTLISSLLPVEVSKVYSSDRFESVGRQSDLYTIEYLNRLTPSGYPEHIISLKKGIPLMLLRNLCPKEGFCNGTKLIFIENLRNKLLKLLNVRACFATTINKSQGNYHRYRNVKQRGKDEKQMSQF